MLTQRAQRGKRIIGSKRGLPVSPVISGPRLRNRIACAAATPSRTDDIPQSDSPSIRQGGAIEQANCNLMGGVRQNNPQFRSRRLPSVPIPKFVSICGALVRTSESIRTLATYILVVPLLNPKFASERSASLCELRVRGTSVPIPKFVSICGALVGTSESIRTLATLSL